MDDIKDGMRGLFLVNLEIMEKVFSVPVEEREALLLKLTTEHQATYLGHTDKTAPELATECLKAGIKAKSYVSGRNKKKDLTITEKSDKLLETKKPPM